MTRCSPRTRMLARLLMENHRNTDFSYYFRDRVDMKRELLQRIREQTNHAGCEYNVMI